MIAVKKSCVNPSEQRQYIHLRCDSPPRDLSEQHQPLPSLQRAQESPFL